jgi:outer membrane protein insertion porin family
MDLRYPLTLSPMSTIYVHGFYEAGNAWNDLQYFNNNDVQQVVGTGVRIFLPMLGLIGFDFGIKIGAEYQGKSFGERTGVFFTIGMDPY